MTPQDAIQKLIAKDWTETTIGKRVGASQSAINRYKAGARTPPYFVGKKLIDLAQKETRK